MLRVETGEVKNIKCYLKPGRVQESDQTLLNASHSLSLTLKYKQQLNVYHPTPSKIVDKTINAVDNNTFALITQNTLKEQFDEGNLVFST